MSTSCRAPEECGENSVHIQRLHVAFDYPVVFTRDVFAPDNPTLREVLRRREPSRRHRLCVFVDSGVHDAFPSLPTTIAQYADRHRDHLALVAPAQVVPGGERAKRDPELLETILAQLHALGMDRQSYAVIVGGGAVLDAVGYAAAIVHRGLRTLRIPTTVLAQNDAGVGVKNGINAFGAKNFLGTFCPPFAVINDQAFIRTLAPRDRRAGIAEAVKVALIRDRDFFLWLEQNLAALCEFQEEAMAQMIRRGAELHLRHIAEGGDPFELGMARPLDFGHWAAHRLEGMTQHRLRHGEAVAIGMAIDSIYSHLVGVLDLTQLQRVLAMLRGLGFQLSVPELTATDESGELDVLQGLKEFQEHLGGELTLTLLKAIGRGEEESDIARATMRDAILRLSRSEF